jgi:hypothetical protein
MVEKITNRLNNLSTKTIQKGEKSNFVTEFGITFKGNF